MSAGDVEMPLERMRGVRTMDFGDVAILNGFFYADAQRTMEDTIDTAEDHARLRKLWL